MTEHWKGIFKLMEEMAELQQVLAKLAAFPDGRHPDIARGAPPLLDRLVDELADVDAALRYFLMVNEIRNAAGSNRKLERFMEWDLPGVRPAEHDDA